MARYVIQNPSHPIFHQPPIGIYSSSKAALLALSETLRLELKPFGVQVLSVMTGAVQTMIFQTNYSLPPDSAYLAWEKQIAAQAEGSEQAFRMSAPVYAERVVDDILNRRRSITYRGQMASFAYWVVALMPPLLRVSATGDVPNGSNVY
jgi:short-subunit dehydrogenase